MHYTSPSKNGNYIWFYVKECLTSPVNKQPLKPIVEKDFLARLQVNLIDFRNCPDDRYSYIGHVVDHLTKYHISFPLKTKTAQEVSTAIQEQDFSYIGLPRNPLMMSYRLFEDRGIDTIFVHGRPSHAQY